MTLFIKMKDELDAFPIKGDMKEFMGELNIAFAQGKNFVILPKPDDSPRMIAVHNISYADEVVDEGSVF
jgi:hypothetical protein